MPTGFELQPTCLDGEAFVLDTEVNEDMNGPNRTSISFMMRADHSTYLDLWYRRVRIEAMPIGKMPTCTEYVLHVAQAVMVRSA